jgi:hypothetical protein
MTCVNQDCSCNNHLCVECGQFHSPYALCADFYEHFSVRHSQPQKKEGEVTSGVPDYAKLNDRYPQPEIKVQKEEPGLKFDAGKPPMNLLSREALTQIAKVLEFGSRKYEAHNWRKGMSWSRLLGAAMRHLTAFNDGEDVDPETGLSHLAHLGCCTMFLLEYQRFHQSFDDRYKVENKVDK